MITSREIIYTMGISEMTFIQFRRELLRYKRLTDLIIHDIIDTGTKGLEEDVERLVAWVLGLKKFIPNGWMPTERTTITAPRQLAFNAGWYLDPDKRTTGEDHYKRKGISCDN